MTMPALVFDSIQLAHEVIDACTVASRTPERPAGAEHPLALQHPTARLYALTCPRCIALARGMSSNMGVETMIEESLWRPAPTRAT